MNSLFLWNLRKAIWERSSEYAEKEIPSDKKQKKTFCETALCHVKSIRTVKLRFSLSSILTLFLFSLCSDMLECSEAFSEKGNIFRNIMERRFLRSSFVTCAFHSQGYTFFLLEEWGIPFGVKATRGH